MSMKYLGESFDIHTGGIDHIPIHHTNEIAQSEGATGKKWVNYWLHNEFLVIAKTKDGEEGGKMSKSSGNFLTLQTLVDKGYDPLDYRFFLLGAHYRSQVAFSFDAMDSAKNARKALVSRVAKVLAEDKDFSYTEEAILAKNDWSEAASKVIAAFTKAIEDDLSTPKALSELQVAIKNPEIPATEKLALIAKLDSVLGLDLIAKAKESLTAPTETGNANSDPEIDALVVERNEAKKAKNWARADEIRNILKGKGIVLVDTPEGTIWKKE